MKATRLTVLILLPAASLLAQSAVALPPHATLPILFSKTVAADHAKAGDRVEAVTLQAVKIGAETLPRGSHVWGHVLAAQPFASSHAAYAAQVPGTLTVQFDDVEVHGQAVPLHVVVRALATPLATEQAEESVSTDLDPTGTRTLVGGDLLVPSQKEVSDREGDVVAYNTREGVYARLKARGECDGGTEEVAVGIFSASACGAYGFGETHLIQRGSAAAPSILTLSSTHGSPRLWKNTTALLEVLPGAGAVESR